MDATLFPDLAAERERLAFARRCREAALARFRTLLEHGSGAADEITEEYVEVTLLRAVADLEPEDAADFFGRIDTHDEVLRIGKRHIEDGRREPVVLDWRAPAAAAFYRATLQDPFGLTLRRRYSLKEGELVSYSDEHLEHPSDDEVVGGIPDPVLAEIGAARSGAMREVVATIQAEQDLVIRAPAEQALVVQGGPGTGKTAVGLHRAAYLLFEHRERLEREGVLVVGPNRVFLDYIAGVLPSLGERSVQQQSLPDLLRPRLPIADGVVLPAEVVALLGDPRWVAVLERAALARLRRDPAPLRLAHGARLVRVEPDELVAWLDQGVAGRMPLNRRREGFRLLVAQEIGRRMTDRDGNRPPLPAAARKVIDRMWPVLDGLDLVRRLLTRPADLSAAADGLFDGGELKLLRRTASTLWTLADVSLVDEARALVDGPPVTFGHVVVDEAQDLTPLGLRAVARRTPSRSLTVLGDLAQATAPGSVRSWVDALSALGAASGTVAHLTVGYRVPGPVLELAERLLPLAGVVVPGSKPARVDGAPARAVVDADLWPAVAAALRDLRTRHSLSGVIVPDARHEEAVAALVSLGLRPAGRIDHLQADEIPVLPASAAKGLELDGVVVADPAALLALGEPGARLLYIALTRAVQELVLVAGTPLPEVLRP